MKIPALCTLALCASCGLLEPDPTLEVSYHEWQDGGYTIVDFLAEANPADSVWWTIEADGVLSEGIDGPGLVVHRVIVLDGFGVECVVFHARTKWAEDAIEWRGK